MASGRYGAVNQSIRTLFDAGALGGLADAQLLDRYLAGRGGSAEAAFEALVARHGPMVLGVCGDVLRDPHDVQDAFQATFLVLARRAKAIRRRDSLASWLYGVARRVALRAKSDAARRRGREREVAERAATGYAGADEPQDFSALHEEVGRLPEKYRAPVVLCYLQGMTYEAAAETLRCPLGTLSVRLKRARERLQDRLTRRGAATPAGFWAAAATPKAMTAAVPPALLGATVRGAFGIRVGGAAVAGAVPGSVALLAERTVWAMRGKVLGANLVVGGLVVVLATTSLAVFKELRAQDSRQRAPVAKPAGPWVKALPGGTKVELLGVSTYPSGKGTWWRPDGTPLPEVPYTTGGARVNFDKDQQAREFAVRVTHPAGREGSSSDRWQVPSTGGAASGTPRDAWARGLPGLSMIAVSLPAGRKSCPVRFGVASGPWKTEVTGGPEGSSAQGRPTLSVIFGKPHDVQGRTAVTVSHDESEDDIRVVAADRAGKEHAPSRVQSFGVKGYRQVEAEYDLPPSDVKEFRVQSRPYEWAAFEDVALNPRRD